MSRSGIDGPSIYMTIKQPDYGDSSAVICAKSSSHRNRTKNRCPLRPLYGSKEKCSRLDIDIHTQFALSTDEYTNDNEVYRKILDEAGFSVVHDKREERSRTEVYDKSWAYDSIGKVFIFLSRLLESNCATYCSDI